MLWTHDLPVRIPHNSIRPPGFAVAGPQSAPKCLGASQSASVHRTTNAITDTSKRRASGVSWSPGNAPSRPSSGIRTSLWRRFSLGLRDGSLAGTRLLGRIGLGWGCRLRGVFLLRRPIGLGRTPLGGGSGRQQLGHAPPHQFGGRLNPGDIPEFLCHSSHHIVPVFRVGHLTPTEHADHQHLVPRLQEPATVLQTIAQVMGTDGRSYPQLLLASASRA